MGYEKLESRQLGRSWQLPYLAAIILAGLALGLAMPLQSASAGAGIAASSTKTITDIDGIVVLAGNKNKNKNKNWNKNWNHKNVVVVRPYRHWNKRAYYGTVIGGVALGTILGAAAYSAAAPAPNHCWYWANPAMTQGYWDYC